MTYFRTNLCYTRDKNDQVTFFFVSDYTNVYVIQLFRFFKQDLRGLCTFVYSGGTLVYIPLSLLTNTIKLRVKACPQNLLYKGAPNCVIDQGMNSIKEIIEVVDICNKWFGRKMALEDEFRIESHHTIELHFLLEKYLVLGWLAC